MSDGSPIGASSRPVALAPALVVIAALALLLRLWGIGRPSLWFDEALELQRASAGLAPLIVGRGIDQDPPLYAMALHVWQQVAATDAGLRLPSAIMGSIAAVLGALWGRRVGGVPLGVSTGFLLAVAPVAVHYGQEVNQYSTVTAFAAGLGLALERVLARDGRWRWPLYSGLAALSLALHYGFGFLLAAQLLPILRAARSGAIRAAPAAAHLAVLGATAAALWAIGLSRSIGVAHLQGRFGGTDVAKELAYVIDVGWRDLLVFFSVPFAGGPALNVALLTAVLAALGGIWLWGKGPPGRRVVTVSFLGTLALSYVASGFGLYPLGHRYGLIAFPAYMMAVGGCAAALWDRRPAASALTLAAVGLALAAFLPQLDERNAWLSVPREELRPVLSETAARLRPRDTVYVYIGAQPAFDLYWPRVALGTAEVVRGEPYDEWTAAAEASRIASVVPSGSATWLVFSHVSPRDHERLLDALLLSPGSRWRLVERIEDENAIAYRLERQ